MCIYTYIFVFTYTNKSNFMYLHIQIKVISLHTKKSFKMLYIYVYTCMHANSLQSCPAVCDSMNCSPPGSSVHWILQARTLEWVPCSHPEDLPNPGIEVSSLKSPEFSGGFFTTNTTWKACIYTYI